MSNDLIKGGDSKSAMKYVIEALIPLTDANLKLTFSPSLFFRELEERSPHKAKRLANAYYRAQKKGIIQFVDGHFAISDEYLQTHRKSTAEELPDNQIMIVIYDIPEAHRKKRRELRSLLTQLDFSQEQKSVWVSSYNHFEPLLALIGKLKIAPYVTIYTGSTAFDQYMLM